MTVWSAEASSRLEELYDEGRSASVISDLLYREGLINVSRNAIIGRAHRLKLPARAPRRPQRKPQPPKQSKQARQNELRRLKRAAERKAFEMDHETRTQLRCEPIEPLNIAIHDLTDDTCRFPYGDHPHIVYCGHPTLGGSWCLVHAARCFGSD